jgi:hypothetical protein
MFKFQGQFFHALLFVLSFVLRGCVKNSFGSSRSPDRHLNRSVFAGLMTGYYIDYLCDAIITHPVPRLRREPLPHKSIAGQALCERGIRASLFLRPRPNLLLR